MKTVICIWWFCLFILPAHAQELTYFERDENGTSTMTKPFIPKDMLDPIDIEKTGWKMAGVKNINGEGIKLLVWPRIQEAFGDLSIEEKEIVKQISYFFYIDKNFKLLTFITNISNENVEYFHRIEKKVYEFARMHDDVSDFKPYFEFEGEFKGVMLRIPFSWMEKGLK